MQKSKLGISVGLLGALICFSALFGGYLATIVLAGYVLLAEENQWLKRTGVKAVILMVLFSLASALIGFIPDTFGLINDVVLIFSDDPVSLQIVSRIVELLSDILYFAEKVIFIIFGIKALGQKPLYIPVVDNFVSKYMN